MSVAAAMRHKQKRVARDNVVFWVYKREDTYHGASTLLVQNRQCTPNISWGLAARNTPSLHSGEVVEASVRGTLSVYISTKLTRYQVTKLQLLGNVPIIVYGCSLIRYSLF